MRLLALFFVLAGFGGAAASELTVSGTRFRLDGKSFPYTGVSFFNAIYNTNFNATSEARVVWLKKFQSFGINVLRVWCQWDSTRGFVDTAPSNTMYHVDGSFDAEHLQRLKSILSDADSSGLYVDLVLSKMYSKRVRGYEAVGYVIRAPLWSQMVWTKVVFSGEEFGPSPEGGLEW